MQIDQSKNSVMPSEFQNPGDQPVHSTTRVFIGEGNRALFLTTVQDWISVHQNDPCLDSSILDFRANWNSTSGLLVMEMAHRSRVRRIFLSGWDHGIRWATDWPGGLELMPLDCAPDVPVLQVDSEWAAPWRGQIPINVLETLAHFSTEQWFLLCWASQNQAALDLLLSCPLLIWLLLTTARRERWPDSRIEACLNTRRRDILAACGMDARKSALKLLNKFCIPPYGRQAFALMAPWLRDRELVHSFSHYRTVSLEQLRFLRKHPELADSPLVRDAPAGDGKHFYDIGELLADTQRMREQLNAGAASRFLNLQAMQREHDRLIMRLNELEDGIQAHGEQYPDAPLPGTELIVPITGYGELALESRTQSHCVRSYHGQIKAGHYYVYRVLHPERATLGLSLSRTSPPRIDQLKGYRNEPVSEETQRFVLDWLEQALKGQPEPDGEAHPGQAKTDHQPGTVEEYSSRVDRKWELVDSYSVSAVIRVVGIGVAGSQAVRHRLAGKIGGVEFAVVEGEGANGQGFPACSAITHGQSPAPDDPPGQGRNGPHISSVSGSKPFVELLRGCDLLFLVADLGCLEDIDLASRMAEACKANSNSHFEIH
jgi:hypothetical protein